MLSFVGVAVPVHKGTALQFNEWMWMWPPISESAEFTLTFNTQWRCILFIPPMDGSEAKIDPHLLSFIESETQRQKFTAQIFYTDCLWPLIGVEVLFINEHFYY